MAPNHKIRALSGYEVYQISDFLRAVVVEMIFICILYILYKIVQIFKKLITIDLIVFMCYDFNS